jgi:hypothetical protein
MKTTNYIIAEKIDLNEGFTTGTVTKAFMLMTKKYIFVIPFESIGQTGLTIKSATYNNAREFIENLKKNLNEDSLSEVEGDLKKSLPENRVYEVSRLEKLTVQVGFWIFGGMRIKKSGGSLQVVNVQPKTLRAEIKDFYGL